MNATENSKGSFIITGGSCRMLLEFSKAVLNKCVAIDLPLLRAIQESALRSLGFVCHIKTLIWFLKAGSSTSVPCRSCLNKTQITPLDCLTQVAWIFFVRPLQERPIPFRLRSLFLRPHCADGLEKYCCQSGHTYGLPRQLELQSMLPEATLTPVHLKSVHSRKSPEPLGR